MRNEPYNGWTNYETWKANLEVCDCWLPETIGFEYDYGDTIDSNIYEAAELTRELAEHIMFEGVDRNSYAWSAINMRVVEVQWSEIAEHIIEDDVNQHKAALKQQEEAAKPLTPSTTLFAA